MNYLSFSDDDIVNMDTNYRIQLINSIGGYRSLCLIGTKNDAGQSNLGIFSSVFHLGSAPALYGFVSRPADRERHTLENILETGVYTMNQVDASFYEQAHQASAKYPREVSEFEALDFTEQYQEGIQAPFVQEAKVKFALAFQEDYEMQNKCKVVIGKVISLHVAEDLVAESGFIDLSKAQTLAGSGCNAYYKSEFIAQKPYARPPQQEEKLT